MKFPSVEDNRPHSNETLPLRNLKLPLLSVCEHGRFGAVHLIGMKKKSWQKQNRRSKSLANIWTPCGEEKSHHIGGSFGRILPNFVHITQSVWSCTDENNLGEEDFLKVEDRKGNCEGSLRYRGLSSNTFLFGDTYFSSLSQRQQVCNGAIGCMRH